MAGEGQPTGDMMTPSSGGLATQRAGGTIGAYRLLELIGEGGFGEVWLAEQREPFARRVAIKLVKAGMDSKAVLARFEQERKALALMDHPNIAKVHDAGTTPQGRPYFVMEHVKGAPITDYCDKARLTITQRLELFSKVCHAVQHAHMKGIIHRDLKPSNILITVGPGSDKDRSGEARPVVIDFGVAKAIAARLTEKTIYTEQGQLIGTPEYMSPEQAEMAETDIDTRSDVYALGVILYELLAGALPFDPKTLRSAGYAAIQKMIREVDPPRPSTRLSQMSDVGGGMSESGAPDAPPHPTSRISHRTSTATGIADRRRSTLPDLLHTLKSELEWIPLKAMRKERTERYRSASELSEDVANYLEHRPLIAGPESATYRLKKFARRNRVGVIAGVVALAALLVGLGGTVWQAREASLQRDRAQLERDAADQSRRESELIARFMSDTLNGAGPSVARGRDITMLKEMMDSAVARIERGDLKSAPAAELSLRETIGTTYKELALYPESARMLEPALALARSLHPTDHAQTAGALTRLAQLQQARGNLDEAEPLFREAIAMERRLSPGDHEDIAGELSDLAVLLQTRGDLAAAEPLYRESLDMWKRIYPGDHQDVAGGMTNLAFLLLARNELEGAESLVRESLDMNRRLFPGDHPDVANGLNNLAFILKARGELGEAEQLYRDSLAMLRRLFPDDHPLVARGLSNLASLLEAKGEIAAAGPALREAWGIRRRVFGETDPAALATLYRLVNVLIRTDRNADAAPLVEWCVEGNTARFGAAHKETRHAIEQAVTLYERWHSAEPGKGYDAKAAEWRARLDASTLSTPEQSAAPK